MVREESSVSCELSCRMSCSVIRGSCQKSVPMFCRMKTAIRILIFLLESYKIELCRLTHAISASWQPSNICSEPWKNWLFDVPVGNRKKLVQELKTRSCYRIIGSKEQMKVTLTEDKRLRRMKQSFPAKTVNKFLHNFSCVWWMMSCDDVIQSWGLFLVSDRLMIVLRTSSVKLSIHILLVKANNKHKRCH